MGSSQVRRDESGRVNISIIPQSHRSSSMAGHGSISPSSLHNTTLFSTSPQSASPAKTETPAEKFGQVLSEDTIPVPRDKTSQNPLRSTPPPIPESLRLPTELPLMGDFSADIVLSAEQVEEITRPPRPSSEAPAQHTEPQVSDEEAVESLDAETEEGDFDWKPPVCKKGNQKKGRMKSPTQSTSTGKPVKTRVVNQRISQHAKTAMILSTGNKRRKGKNSSIYLPGDEPDEDTQATLPLTSRVDNTASKTAEKDDLSHIHAAKWSEIQKPIKKGATRVPKKSFFDKQNKAEDGNCTGEDITISKEAEPESKGDNISKSVSTSRRSKTIEKSEPASGRPRANKGSSRTVKGATRTELKINSTADKGNGGGNGLDPPVSGPKDDKVTSAPKMASFSIKTAPVAQLGSNQKKKRNPTYGSAKRPFRVTVNEGPENHSSLTTGTSRRAINTTSENASSTAQALGLSTQKVPQSARSRSANLSIHSAGPSELMSDPISDDIDTFVSTSREKPTIKKRLLNSGRSEQTKPDSIKSLKAIHKSAESDMNKLDMTMDPDVELISNDIVSFEAEDESSPIEAPSIITHPVLQNNPVKDVFKENDKDVRPSELPPTEGVNHIANSTKYKPLVDEMDSTRSTEKRSAMDTSHREQHQPSSSSTHLNRKSSIVSETGSPLKYQKRNRLDGNANFRCEEKGHSRARQQAKPLPPHQSALDTEQALGRGRHYCTVPKAATIPERDGLSQEVDTKLLDHLVRSFRAEPSSMNHFTSTLKSPAPPAEPVNVPNAQCVTSTNQQPTMHNYQSTIAFINKVAAMDQEAHLENLHVLKQSEVPRNELELPRDVWNPRAVASHEHEVSTETSRYKTLRQQRSLLGPQMGNSTVHHKSTKWAKWQNAVDDASEGVVDTLHSVITEMLRHLSSKESAVTGVLDEYKYHGKRISNALVKKQDHERHNVAVAFHQQAMKFNQEFRGLANDDTIDDKTPARGRRLIRYDDWQREVHNTRDRIRELRS